MYQYATFAPLAQSKIYVETIPDCVDHLRECVVMTNKFRKKKTWPPLSQKDIENGCSLVWIDLEKEPEALALLGPATELDTENLSKTAAPGQQLEDGE